MIHALSVSGSSGKQEPGIYTSLVIPTLLIGTVGGGTGTPTAKECLQAIGCFGKVGMKTTFIAWIPGGVGVF